MPGTSKPIVDGGTEGLKGHSRVILPGESADFEDTLDLFPPQTGFPLCTLVSPPRRSPRETKTHARQGTWLTDRPGGFGSVRCLYGLQCLVHPPAPSLGPLAACAHV